MPDSIMIGIPTYETISNETFESISDILSDHPKDTIVFKYVTGYGVAQARNKLVDYAIKIGVDKLFFVDNDVVLKPNALTFLLSSLSHSHPIVLGYYAKTTNKIWQGATSLFKMGERDYTQTYTAEEIKRLRDDGVYQIEVHGGGFGCALIDMDIFRKIDYPWFNWRFYPGEKRRKLSEDFYFCSKCRKAGIPIIADTRVGCGHVLHYVQEVM